MEQHKYSLHMEDWPYLANVTYPHIVVVGKRGAVLRLSNREELKESSQSFHSTLKLYNLSYISDGQYFVISETRNEGIMKVLIEIKDHIITRVGQPNRISGYTCKGCKTEIFSFDGKVWTDESGQETCGTQTHIPVKKTKRKKQP
jgi:hypothetical protein